MIPYGRQDIQQEDVDAVVEALKSDFLTQGPLVPAFEEALAEYVGSAHAVAVNSATSALHIACLALDLGRGDWLWTSPITFVASANCAIYCGASIDFIDIDPVTYNMCPDKLEAKLEVAQTTGKLPKVVVPVHLSGQSCDMKRIHALSKKFGFRIVEDASHAIGGSYDNARIGDCRYSDITVFSFHPVKIITTAEGGLATTGDSVLAQKMRLAASHGITRDPELMTHAPDGPWYYQQTTLGFNYRMTELQAALGISQLKRLDEYVRTRKTLARRYNDVLASLPLITPAQSEDTASSWHLYIISLELKRLGSSHREVFEALRSAGIGVNLHYIPVHLQPFYRLRGYNKGDFPNSEFYYERAISLPLFATMTTEEQDSVCTALRQTLRET